MGRSTPSWIKRGAHPSHETVLYAMVLHATVLRAMVLHATVLHAIAAPGRRQCVQEGGSAVKAHN